MRLEDLALVGNCQFSALIERTGSIVWCCLPRFDSEPVFSTLLDESAGGHFLVGPADGSAGVQRYVDNTNVLETAFDTLDRGVRVTDFVPRFRPWLLSDVRFGSSKRSSSSVVLLKHANCSNARELRYRLSGYFPKMLKSMGCACGVTFHKRTLMSD